MAIYETAWWKLARREYQLKMVFSKARCPGGCDFRWLTLLLAGVLCMVLLLLGTQAGLMNRFVETLLGKVPDYGVPIWVVSSTGHHIGPILHKIQQIVPVFPYRDIAPEKIHLPGVQDHRKTPFPGRAVYLSDPLWKLSTTPPSESINCFPQLPSDSTDTLPLEVTLNKSWFIKNFNYSAYRNTLIEQKLPPPCIPPPESKNPLNDLQVLWLDIEHKQHELIPFKIRWTEQIPAMEKLAFLFPITTYHVMLVAKDLPKLHYYPEMQGGTDVRIEEIFIPEEYLEEDMNKKRQDFINCTQGTMQNDAIQFPKPLPIYWVQACAKTHHLPYSQDWNLEVSNGDKISHDSFWGLFLPCRRLSDTYQRMLSNENNKICTQQPDSHVPLNMFGDNFRISRALVYTKDYNKLSEIKNKLLQLKINGKQALYLHSIYKKSIDRFDFLAASLKMLKWPYGLIFGVFLTILLLWVNIGTLIGHRRSRYGILLAKGMPEKHIYYMVFFQLFLATSVGLCCAIIIFVLIKFGVNGWFYVSVLEVHRDNLDIIGTLDLLPLNWLIDVIIVWTSGLFVTVMVASIHLYLMPLRYDTAPSELLQS